MIEVKNISQSYSRQSDNETLSDINITVRENTITALVGANGAGKSTLLSVMTNLLPAKSGQVMLDGVDVRKIKTSEIAKKVAFLKQTHHLSIRITIKDLVEYGRFPHCGGRLKDADKEKVAEAITYMNLEDLVDKYLDEISGGQRQRAFIAMILAQDTPYIFLDEPLNNLDIKYSVEMMKIVGKLVSDLGKTVVVVLHDINFAAAYAGHIIAMKDGKVYKEGAPLDVITPEVLDPVFDHNFHITKHDGRPICLYYDHSMKHIHNHGDHVHMHEHPHEDSDVPHAHQKEVRSEIN
ncbi:MAG: ATP-binding cassette domain-containing protein [Oscillospiraceae bacterium]|nr:ATP-binding cassette domain-containing protein [Oscillospiraceae bacterium]MCL2278434.1 ATP-binding cassette domain-containing protein [Oscillospiraceae bacterium]